VQVVFDGQHTCPLAHNCAVGQHTPLTQVWFALQHCAPGPDPHTRAAGQQAPLMQVPSAGGQRTCWRAVPQSAALGQQVPLTQVEPAAQQVWLGSMPQTRAAGQHAPLMQDWS
jgi:hypothetical protein